MNIRNILFAILMSIFVSSCFTSCGVDRWKEYAYQTGLDEWIDATMRQNYLWYKEMPSSKELNYFIAPENFLKSVIYTDDKISSVDTLISGPGYGFDFTLYKMENRDTAFLAQVSYIIPGSPAAKAGLKRGEWIMKVDGDTITTSRLDWLSTGGERKLIVGEFTTGTNESGAPVSGIVSKYTTTMPASVHLEDNPVHYTNIYQRAGKKIGYLVYSHFTSGPSADSQAYNNELRNASKEFATAGVNEFILDLRYNNGGDLDAAELLCDMLAPFDKMGEPLAELEYNDKNSAKNGTVIFDKNLLLNGSNLNLPQVYVLVSDITASTAEMVINCLKPYMTVTLIGTKTKGINLGIETYINEEYSWKFMPVVCRIYNSKGEADYASGFTPDYEVNEASDFSKFLPFGDPNEALLSVALGLIDGTYPPNGNQGEEATAKLKAKVIYNTLNRKAPTGIRIK